MIEQDRMITRYHIEGLLVDTSPEDRLEIMKTIEEFQFMLKDKEIHFDVLSLLVFLYKKDLAKNLKEKNEKE